ncbi:MAG TPA: potassium-transporting ATPase subunit KdpC [Candidatus Tumulicola sp.]|nr:potassium-transporting ATPase subunit KdpC [Candidatus Tumulicola sp.]
MFAHASTALRITIASIVLLGLVYPLVMTGVAEGLFPRQANGSLVVVRGKAVGSWIVGQRWTKPADFQGRPSAAGTGYDPAATGGTNLGPTSAKLIAATRRTLARLEKQNPRANGPPPIDLVTSSASGIDPDISPEAAYWEAPRVAAARHLRLSAVRSLVAAHVRGRQFGFLGEPHVNVLELNLALDGLDPQ